MGTHSVTIHTPCQDITIPVSLINYPHFFTPNQDGYNDTWNIVGLENDNSARIYIFDRYGKLLKQISPSGDGWDGTYNGTPLPSTDYWFTVFFNENGAKKEFKAHFSLKR
jgi:gliding motility-associated-like protein